MKYTTILCLLLFSFSIYAKVQSTVQSGNWNSPSTWNSNQVPTASDSILISPNDTLFINSSTAVCNHILTKGTLYFRSSSNQLDCNSITSQQQSNITGTQLGTLNTNTFINQGDLSIGKIKLTVNSSFSNYNRVIFTFSNGFKSFNQLINTGSIENIANGDIAIGNKLHNQGEFYFQLGKITFIDTAFIQSSTLLVIDEIQIEKQLTNHDSLLIHTSLKGQGELINRGYIEYSGSNSNLSIQKINLELPNTLHLSGNYHYQLPTTKDSLFFNLRISNGKLICKYPSYGKGLLHVSHQTTISIQSNFCFPEFDKYLMDSASTLSLSENTRIKFSRNMRIHNVDLQKNSQLDLIQTDTLSISGNCSGTGAFINQHIIDYCGSTPQEIKKMNYQCLIYNNKDSIGSELKGNYKIQKLISENGILKISGLNIDTLFINTNGRIDYSGSSIRNQELILAGKLNILNTQPNYEFKNVFIHPSGIFNNLSNSNFSIHGNLENNGSINSCLGKNCKYTFTSASSNLLGASPIELTQVFANNLNNNSKLIINTSLQTDTFIALPYSTLELQMDSNNYSGNFNFQSFPNRLSFNRSGNQFISSCIDNVQSLSIRNIGDKILYNNINILDSLTVDTNASLKTDTFEIHFQDSSIFSLYENSNFSIGHNYSFRDLQLSSSLQTNNIYFHPTSSFHYLSKSDKTISTVPKYGNLHIDDGSVASSITTIQNDSLIISGNLDIEESSITLESNQQFISVSGDWNGPGNCQLNQSVFELKGNGNASGKLTTKNSPFIYNGTNSQRIKVGAYNKLILNNHNEAYTKANTGTLEIDSLLILNGTFNFAGEESTVEYIEVHDSVIFSSRFQDKIFYKIQIEPAGVFTLDYDRPIRIKNSIICNGELKNPKGVISFTDTSDQKISGTGKINLGKVKISKHKGLVNLNCNLKLTDTLQLDTGDLLLSNAIIKLGPLSFIDNENLLARISGDKNSKLISSDVILANDTSLFNGIGIEIHSSLPLFNTTVERNFTAVEIAGKPSIKSNYSIEPKNNENLNATLVYNYHPKDLNNHQENNLTLWKTEDQVNWIKIETDLNNHQLKANNIYSFSTWTGHQKNMNLLSTQLVASNATRLNKTINVSWTNHNPDKTIDYLIKSRSLNRTIKTEGILDSKPGSEYSFSFWNNDQHPTDLYVYEKTNLNEKLLFTKSIAPILEDRIQIISKSGQIEIHNFENGTGKLYDISGRLLQSQKTPIQFQTGNKKGIHFIELKNDKTQETYKVLVK